MSVARDALTANQGALDIVGKNITSASLPGYVRRRPLLESQVVGRDGPGGVAFKGPERVVDRFVEARLLQESSLYGAAELRAEGLMGLEASLSPSGGGGVGARLSAFFGAVTDLASSPADPTKRSAFLSRAEEVAGAFRTAAEGLAARRQDLLGKAGGVAQEINDRLAQIAELNVQIAEATGLGDPAPDLHDRRELLLRETSERIPVQLVREPNGSVSVLSSGTALVTGREHSVLSVSTDAQQNLLIQAARANGVTVDITSRVDGGQLGGLREARDRDIPALSSDLDQLAFDLADAMNTVHASGFGKDGGTGRPLFEPPGGVSGAAKNLSISSLMAGQPDRVAASASLAEIPGGNGAALALAGLASQALGPGGTPAARFAALGGKLGGLQVTADNAVALRSDTLGMVETLREQASGVSIEEEMVDLTRYQRAFEASMKVLRVADELLEGLIREV
jgi:flagellar hook-associated protein 1